MDALGVPPFQETTTLYEDDCHISGNQHISGNHHIMMFVFMRIMMNHHWAKLLHGSAGGSRSSQGRQRYGHETQLEPGSCRALSGL